jgi:hypothetical protein
VLVEAVRGYAENTAGSETFQSSSRRGTTRASWSSIPSKQLVGAETVQRLRLLESDLEYAPFDLAASDAVVE